ncbi:hypothetical protein ACFSOZ_11110 [Mesorhizobium newzealandense]|uniref:DUF4190 domain-containing protein n=1 Tax=Mesorhizobium newzealandense TaxID=1300302 RepID=A0ABW4U9H3_9HYPH
MAQWGRSTAAIPDAVVQGRLGKRSVVLALSAFAAGAVAITILVAMPSDASQFTQNIATGFFMAVFLLAAPLAHVTGAVFGVMALVRSNDNRALGILGIILNGLSVMAGLALLAAMASTIGAFT